ncbi:MAG: hypothetical protein ABI574_02910 [Burkholderiales bacterium]
MSHRPEPTRATPPRPPPHAASRHWLLGFGLCVLLMLPALWWSWLTPAPYGDLTRIAYLSETEFGWHEPQPRIDAGLVRQAPLSQADVLVVGDSFSAALLWQSVLTGRGWRVTTVTWSVVGPLCADLEHWLRTQGFKGTSVVLQRVERSVPELVRDSEGCSRMRPKGSIKSVPQIHAPGSHAAPLTHAPGFAVNWRAPLESGPVTAWHTWRAQHGPASFVIHETERVRVQDVPQGCSRFSHRLCRRGLFLADDLDMPAVIDAQVAALPALLPAPSPAGAGLRFVWAVVPNKTTLYLQDQRAARLSDAMRAAVVHTGLGVDLFGALRVQRDRQRDLYFPNDTHFSPAGYLFMGGLIADALGPPPPR